MTDERDVATVLAERPELESALESIRSVDDAHETWTYDDLSIDSGTFGEVVSEGLVEKTGDGYRLPDTTRRALDGEVETDKEQSPGLSLPAFDVDSRAAGALAGALALVVLFRTVFSYGDVFRNGDVVLSGNDPYAYRYYVEQMLAGTGGGFELAVLSEMPSAKGEPFMIATLYSLSSLIGDGASAAGTVLAWYPVVSAFVTGLIVYLLAVKLTDDRRVGLASVVFFATTPAHAMRTSLGYADHHAFDYPWLALTALALVMLARRDETDLRDPWTWAVGLGLGIGVAGQILAWENGPALVFPLALYVGLVVLQDVRADRSPLESNAPLLGGLAVAAALTQLAHSQFGWHTDFVAFTPILLFVGAAGALAVAEATSRLGLSVGVLANVEIIGAVGGLIGAQFVVPTFWADLTRRLDRFFGLRGIVETKALITGDMMWFVLLGFVLFLALPPLVWASRRAVDGSKSWLAASVYAWFFILLGAFQIRFVGELATFTALFAGFGFVWLAHVVDLTDAPTAFEAGTATTARDGGEEPPQLRIPTLREAGTIFVLFLLVGGVGIFQVPIKTDQLTISDEAYGTAAWMDEYAVGQNLTYPDNYVTSRWGRNRMFNYFVNGESRSYQFAQNNHETLFVESDGEAWYQKHGDRVGFIVTEPLKTDKGTLHSRLRNVYGSKTKNYDGLAHYQAVYVSPSDEYKVFRLVPGARINGTAAPNQATIVEKEIEISGASFTYRRLVKTDRTGSYAVRMPYPGEYTIWNKTATVSQRNVTNGETVTAD
ncbi:STT3 domain-containing protein [Halorientalis brevis]|uniref:STT3 domain-containing protein n=1 Tax=Halorientalis brevis TaxID=1126241 RepID=A0ABD6C761_9EURY|nr:STT3 domain-containing protein [Halorientalis brevis]